MDILLLYCVVLIILLLGGIHVATVLFVIALGGALYFLGPTSVLTLGNLAWATLNDFVLTAVPMFILLGELLLRSGVTDGMYRSLAAWLSRLPGGLLHTNIGACALFAATSGSSVATAATIGTVALPTMEARGYDRRMVLGSLAAGGTLGILIPPSINMIIYGAMSNVSIGRLFVGGIVPGIIMTGTFMALIMGLALARPAMAGLGEPRLALGERLRLLRDLLPPLVIFVVVMGGIYLGFATPTEAAAVGVVAALVIAGVRGRVSATMLHDAFTSTIRTTAMVMFIILAAFFLNFVISLVGIPQAITQAVKDLGVSPMATLWVLVVVYVALGMFLETLSMLITTIPIVVPLVVGLGFDPVWFGVLLTVLMELALITPPVGVNLYVIQGVRRDGGNINDVILGVLPFAGAMGILVVLLLYFPGLATWLPNLLFD